MLIVADRLIMHDDGDDEDGGYKCWESFHIFIFRTPSSVHIMLKPILLDALKMHDDGNY